MKRRGASILIAMALALSLLTGLAVTWPEPFGLPPGLLGMVTARSEGADGGHPERAAFAQAAFRAEYDAEGVREIRRWAVPIRIAMDGRFTAKDEATVDAFIAQLNRNVPGLPLVSRAAGRDYNVLIRFAKLEDLPRISGNYVEGNWGFFTFWIDDFWQIEEAQILIATDVTNQKERNHLLLEELTGALGLANDLDDHPDSILYQSWTTTQKLSELDWQLLNILYDKRLSPGMGLDEARRALGWD